MRIKICGLTRLEDALHAARCGADFLGLVAAESPRRVELAAAREVARARVDFPVRTVGVFCRQPRALVLEWIEQVPLDAVQLHPEDGLDWPVPVLLTHRLTGPLTELPGAAARFHLFELFVDGRDGGPGLTFPTDWLRAGELSLGRFFLAGGLTPDNVGERVRRLRPFGVDVSSGVESAPGIKDPERVRRFIEEARRAELV